MAWRNLWRNRRRTLLTLASIVIGVFLAVMFTAIQDGNWTQTIDLAARLGGGHITLQHPDYLRTPKLTLTIRNSRKLVDTALELGAVRRAVARIVGQTMLSTAEDSRGAGFIAIDPEVEDSTTLSILEGLGEGQMFRSADEGGIILGQRLAEILGVKMGNRVVYTMTDVNGEIVSGLGRVSGIIRTGAPNVDAGLCLLPIGAVRRLLGYQQDEAVQVAVFIRDHRNSEEVAGQLQDKIGKAVSALPWFETRPDLAAFIAMKVGGARFVEILIAILVAAGIFNTFFISVMERLREFGILIALGFSPGRLFRLIVVESLWMALLGLLAALGVTAGPYLYLTRHGIDFSSLVNDANTVVAGVALSTTIKVEIYPENAAIIVIFALCATLLSGLYPAWKAGHVEPVESIKLV